jgi:tetraacyldisaccharide 4'-kinase
MGTPIGDWLPDPARLWYGPPHPLSTALVPLSWLYCGVAQVRHYSYRRGWLRRVRLPVPVVVVGNITVGGTGKTPLVLWLAQWLKDRGHRPGILTRGYGGSARDWPQRVLAHSDPAELGDEPVLLARRSGCPVVAGPDRIADGLVLAADLGCDILVSDDGLQHYRLARDIEIAVVDGRRGLGNRRCLPAGPLREPPARLSQVDLVACTGSGCTQGHHIDLVAGTAVNLADPGQTRALGAWCGQPLTAVAGIGNPGRFFALLRSAGLDPTERIYPDHHPFQPADARSWGSGQVLMTEKDAVKCGAFARPNHWYLPVEARPTAAFAASIEQRLEDLIRGQKAVGHPGLPPV